MRSKKKNWISGHNTKPYFLGQSIKSKHTPKSVFRLTIMHAKHAHVQIWIGFLRNCSSTVAHKINLHGIFYYLWARPIACIVFVAVHLMTATTATTTTSTCMTQKFKIYYQDFLFVFFSSPETPTYAIQLKMNGLFISINYWFRLSLADYIKLKTFFNEKRIFFMRYRQIH